MAMGDRPEVQTASTPVAALDVALLAQVLATAMARVPFRRPFAGTSSPATNLATSVTRETIRAFMGFCSALRIPEFRSLELVLDDICKVIMPPVVRTLDVEWHEVKYGGVPGILYVPRHTEPVGVILYLHGGGYIGTSPTMYAFFTARVCRDTSGIPPQRIFLAGDSGGGGLANTLLLERPSHVRPVVPAGLVLFSPEVDLQLDEPSVTQNAERDILPWNIPTAAYLHGFDSANSEVSPLTADLSNFPPTCVTWGGDEMFRDPIRRYVDRLRQAGVPIEAQEFEGMFHVFQILMPWAEASREAFSMVRTFVHKIVADAPTLTKELLVPAT